MEVLGKVNKSILVSKEINLGFEKAEIVTVHLLSNGEIYLDMYMGNNRFKRMNVNKFDSDLNNNK